MFYEPGRTPHGLPHNPLKAIVSPRPIGWISSLAADGTANLAPYSFFNMVSETPPLVMFTSLGRKDSVANIEATGAFVCNLATLDLIDLVNASSTPLPADESEFAAFGIATAPSRLVEPPRVAASPCALECVYVETLRPRGRDGRETNSHMVIGEVIGVHIADEALVDGRLDIARLHVLARCGYLDYAPVDRLVARPRPKAEPRATD
ncbi:flavin reductase family protein [Xanthobacter agilis]|jgi:flavin reductase (DIM6/NTAB) family NADH-FMN oxidoreductase RutF|uniref:Flavin reductase (DIM6/NTAB) family NADH-FMN oxidoreductase RutF n=1 Tax=Xanthobacter agilis TaxID=47492 RepID=A0ABU0LA00_XANAG|nr:flavin reductase family protein [Xanthobacter agilis]MDQ0503956.1 flavin reductase (DIM6/NTAB) family NADH-FMN oxidoreductase RutF [Xanthobacter agilis]